MTEAALESFFKILQQKEVSLEDLDSKLRKVAAEYKRLQECLTGFISEDPDVRSLRKQAKQDLESGDIDNSEKLLLEVKKKDENAIEELKKF